MGYEGQLWCCFLEENCLIKKRKQVDDDEDFGVFNLFRGFVLALI